MKEKKQLKKNWLYLARISYDGSNFNGWAKQPCRISIQELIEEKLSTAFGRKIAILGSSRTDKGVHALDQCFTFKIDIFFSDKEITKKLRKIFFKEDIYIKKVNVVNNNFHPIANVSKKEYKYLINTGNFELFKKNYCWQYNKELNVVKIRKIANLFVGEHDYFNYSFIRKYDKNKKNSIRKIEKISILKRLNKIIFRIISKGFLRYQIRAIIGEIIACYEGKISCENITKKLNCEIEKKYIAKAPACGLYLAKIFFKKNINKEIT